MSVLPGKPGKFLYTRWYYWFYNTSLPGKWSGKNQVYTGKWSGKSKEV